MPVSDGFPGALDQSSSGSQDVEHHDKWTTQIIEGKIAIHPPTLEDLHLVVSWSRSRTTSRSINHQSWGCDDQSWDEGQESAAIWMKAMKTGNFPFVNNLFSFTWIFPLLYFCWLWIQRNDMPFCIFVPRTTTKHDHTHTCLYENVTHIPCSHLNLILLQEYSSPND